MDKVKRNPWPWAMLGGLLALYLLLPTKNYFWDGVDFAQHIEDAPRLDSSLIHPNHLLYNVFGYLVYSGFQFVGFDVRAIEALQIASAIVSVLSAFVLFRILARTLNSTYLSVALTLLFALSATWWKYSTDADSYIPSVFFLLLAFWFLLPESKPRPLIVALLHSAAMMFHQMAVFFFPAAIVGILLQARKEPPRRRALLSLQYCLAAPLLTILVFYYSFYLQTDRLDFQTYFKWLTSLSPEPGHTFSVWGNLSYTLNGHVKLFTSGRLLFLKDSLDFVTIVLLAVLLALVVALVVQVIRHSGELKALFTTVLAGGEDFRPLRILCLAWILPFLIFQYFFVPQHTFYRLFYLPAIILLIGTYLRQHEMSGAGGRGRYGIALLVAAIALSNFVFYIRPLAQVRNYPPLEVALNLNGALAPGTVIYFASRNSDNSLVRYFNPSTTWVEINREIKPEDLERIPQGVPVWLETSLVDLYRSTPEGAKWLELHTLRRPEYEFVNDKYRLQFHQLKTESLAAPK
jgi:hypothetical protein